jgi:hypothetical protein
VNITLQDRTDVARVALVDADTLPIVAARWLTDDGSGTESSDNVRELVRALRRGDWPAVHAIADHLSFDVDVVA